MSSENDTTDSPHQLDLHVSSSEPEGLFISRRELQLELRNLRSNLSLLILGSVALNQFLSSIAVPSFVSGAGVLGLATLKIVSVVVARS